MNQNKSTINIMNDYPNIKKNIIQRFLNPLYQYTCVNNIMLLINDIKTRMPFDVEYNESAQIICVDLGDGVGVNIHINFAPNDNSKYHIKSFN